MISASITNGMRKTVYRRDGWRCALCDSNRGIQIHHVIPRSQGGSSWHPHNLITLCWTCHAIAHGSRIPDCADYMNTEEVNQACVEYVADWYAPYWYPYMK